jgi:50S ribosomal subunit-associated GTPase HflX
MYSVVEFTSCSELVFWSKLAQGLGCRVVLVANKIDDRFSFQKREEEIIYGKTLADKRGYEFVAISALTGEKVEELVGLMIKGKCCLIQRSKVNRSPSKLRIRHFRSG